MLFVAGVFTLYMQQPEADICEELFPLGLPEAAIRARLSAVSSTPKDIRERLRARHIPGIGWEYTFNELALTPLINLRPSHGNKLICPRPQLLVRRLLAGAYYDLVKQPGFPNAFGDAVEDLVGDILKRLSPSLTPSKPNPYQTRDGVRHGADWLLSDGSGHAFIECKSARIPLQAKFAATHEDLRDGMQRLADAIAQNYRNIDDALAGTSDFIPDGLPTFCVVVTLEDWTIFSPTASETLRKLVEQRLSDRQLPISYLATSPYTVLSVRDLPSLAGAMVDQGIAPLLMEKCSPKYAQYMVNGYLEERGFRPGSHQGIFQEDCDELFQLFHEPNQLAKAE